MSLIKCKECGADVSDKAKACPKCGATMPRRTSRTTWLVTGLIAIGALGAIFRGTPPPAAPQPIDPKEAAERQAEADRIALAKEVHRAVKTSLRDPDSLKFRVMLVNTKATVACGQYQAKNGFGGMNQAAVIAIGNKIQPATEALWRQHCTGALDYLTYVD